MTKNDKMTKMTKMTKMAKNFFQNKKLSLKRISQKNLSKTIKNSIKAN